MLVLAAVAAVSPLALVYLSMNLYAAGVSVYFGGDLGQRELAESFLDPFAGIMVGGGLPVLYLVLTAAVSGLMTRVAGAINAPQGLLLGFVSAVGIQLLGRAFGPFDPWELVYYPLLGVAGGWLGAVLSRGPLARQEALYQAADALFCVGSPRDVAVAVGVNLAGPSQERVSLWGISPDAGDNGDFGLDALGSWASGAAKAWP